MKTSFSYFKRKEFLQSKILGFYTLLYVFVFSLSNSLNAQTFDITKNILITQFYNKPDGDDIHSQAAFGSLFANSDFAVMSAYAEQSGKYINSALLFNMVFGSENTKWTDAHTHCAGSAQRVHVKVKPILLAGESDITANWVAKLIVSGIPATTIKANLIVVQHSNSNKGATTSADLTYLKKKTTYKKKEMVRACLPF